MKYYKIQDDYDLSLESARWKVNIVDTSRSTSEVREIPYRARDKDMESLFKFSEDFINALSIKIDKPKPTMKEFNDKKLAALGIIRLVQSGKLSTEETDGREQLVPALEQFLKPFRNDFGTLNDSNLFRIREEGDLDRIGNIIPSLDKDKWVYNIMPTGNISFPESSDLETLSQFYKDVVSRITYKPETETVSESKNIKIAKTIIKLVEKQYQRKKHG